MLIAVPATAVPALSVELTRSPAMINRGDEFVSYAVEIDNTSASDSTSGTLSVSIELPEGLTLAAASGSEWSCDLVVETCSSSKSVGPGSAYPLLSLSQIWIDGSAPDPVTVTARASGAGAPEASGEDTFTFGPVFPFGLATVDAGNEDEAGQEFTRAGGHPYTTVISFEVNTRTSPAGVQIPVEDLHGGVGEIPAGVVANPTVAEALCTVSELKADNCPAEAAVGGALVDTSPPGAPGADGGPLYRLVPEQGYPASFGIKTIGLSYVVRTKLRGSGDFGISALVPSTPSQPAVYGAAFTFCGYGARVGSGGAFQGCKKRTEPDRNPMPFITLGTSCAGEAPTTRFAIDSWIHRGSLQADGLPDFTDPDWIRRDFVSPALVGCRQLTEEWTGGHQPTVTFNPDTDRADTPAAYTAHVHIPQDGLEDPDGLATSHLKDATITLPEGVSFNPGVGDGLAACSEEQIGLLGTDFPVPRRIRFDARMPSCPPSSKIGLATIRTPLLEADLRGSIYLAAQHDNPFGSDYAIYLAIEEPGVGVIFKLAGKVEADPLSGQLEASFQDNPQLPFDDIELEFFGGGRAAFANPPTCGTFTVEAAATPWSAADPYSPQPHEIARPTDRIQIDSGPGGAPCAGSLRELPFALGFDAGSRDPDAGAASPFLTRFVRPDGAQTIDRLVLRPPPGLVASLRGIPYCSATQIEVARSSSGKAERQGSSCPPGSQVGTMMVGAGPGPNPFYAPGKLYLAGPYKGAPISLVAVVPALAGPFDLGNVVVRSALFVDPATARLRAETDPLPSIVKGIPLRIRDVRVDLDRTGWTRNPTSCEASAVTASAFGAGGATAELGNRFQARGCAGLAFKPKLKVGLGGGTGRNGHPALTVRMTQAAGQANLGRASVVLPRSELLAQSHIRSVCTRAQFARDACPASSIYGRAEAQTPLLDQPLAGPVYLRSSDHKLPDLVVALSGPPRQPIEIDLVGRVDSVNGRIRASFGAIPDAPVSRFVLRMRGGRKSLLANSRDLCRGTHRAGVHLVGQNGKRRDRSLAVKARCVKEHTPTALGYLHR